jgi:hypothetical protein
MITSILTIVLVILCIAVFIAYGAASLFYAVVVLALIVGFINAWLIAKAGGAGVAPKPKAVVKKAKGRRKR